MSGMILCRTKKAENPLVLENVGINIYTIEELCYYIYNNIYIITDDFVNEQLFNFIDTQIGEHELAKQIKNLHNNAEGLASILITILKFADYYNDDEIEKLSELFKMLGTQNIYERIKLRADNFLERKCFYSAIANYEKIISDCCDSNLSGLFYTQVYHNLGTAYAKLFFYNKAAECFKEAYRIGQHSESQKSMLYALALDRSFNEIKKIETDEETQKIESDIMDCRQNANYSDEYRKLQEIFALKESGKVQEYYIELEKCMSEWKNEYEHFCS